MEVNRRKFVYDLYESKSTDQKMAYWKKFLLMDKAYEGDKTRRLAESLNFIPVVPPRSN